MYEIWLALNIVYEIALGIWPALAALLLVWLLMLGLRRQNLSQVPMARLATIALGVAVLVGLALPYVTLSGFGHFGYWVDWANWLAMAAGAGVAVAVWLWPWLAGRAAPRA